MRTPLLVGVSLVAILVGGACGSSSPAAPSVPAGGGGGGGGGSAAPIVIAILGGGGPGAFSPGNLTWSAGTPVQWLNSDTEDHHIVATDGSFDTGVLQPDGTSALITLTTDGAHYYCTLHPGEVGVIRASNGGTPPCSGPYCG